MYSSLLVSLNRRVYRTINCIGRCFFPDRIRDSNDHAQCVRWSDFLPRFHRSVRHREKRRLLRNKRWDSVKNLLQLTVRGYGGHARAVRYIISLYPHLCGVNDRAMTIDDTILRLSASLIDRRWWLSDWVALEVCICRYTIVFNRWPYRRLASCVFASFMCIR